MIDNEDASQDDKYAQIYDTMIRNQLKGHSVNMETKIEEIDEAEIDRMITEMKN